MAGFVESIIYADNWLCGNRNAMIGGLTVLNDLFDDLISEDQFWDGGVGGELTDHIIKLLNNETIEFDIKTTCIKLYPEHLKCVTKT